MVLSTFIFSLLLKLTLAHEHSHVYEPGEQCVLWTDTISPYYNSQETYPFFSLPFCQGEYKDINHHHETLAEGLLGFELQNSGIQINFLAPSDETEESFCSLILNQEKLDAFKYAIANDYIFTMYLDDLPMTEKIGYVEDPHPPQATNEKRPLMPSSFATYYLYTRKNFVIGYNGNQIVEVNIDMADPQPLKTFDELTFSYSVEWVERSTPFSKRFDKYLDRKFFQHKVRWFSMFNSLMMILLLVALVSMILLRTLRKDMAREDDPHDLDGEFENEYGWKQVHGDVFRPPHYIMLFSTIIGCGTHLATSFFLIVCTIMAGDLYEGRGEILQASIFVYAALSFVGGYIGAGVYCRNGGKLWIKQAIFQSFFFPMIVSTVILSVNCVAVSYSSSRAIPLGSFMKMLSICLFGVVPLTIIGAIFGRNISGTNRYPGRVNPVPRPIPPKKWYMSPMYIAIFGGVLPFVSILMEMYFIYASFWAYRIYYVYGFALLVFSILLVVTVCVTIVCTYHLLNGEDYRWWWTSVSCAGSVGFYLFLYSLYYYHEKTKMYGFFQISFYFGYTFLLCISVSLVAGAIGHHGAELFVRKIYTRLKVE